MPTIVKGTMEYLLCKMDGFLGGSKKQPGLTDFFDVIDISHEIFHPTPIESSQGLCRPEVRPFILTKALDLNSPALAKACLENQRIRCVEIHGFQEESGARTLSYRLNDVMIGAITTARRQTGTYIETVTFHFACITWAFNLDSGEGQNQANGFTWDLIKACRA